MARIRENTLNASRGFTLVEMLVSVAIFTVIIMVSVNTLLAMVDANKKAQSLRSVMNNLNAAVESMSRTIRVGRAYHCGDTVAVATPQNCPSGSSIFAFLPSGEDPDLTTNRTVYRLNSAAHQIERSLDSGATWIGITAPEVVVNTLAFYTVGAHSSRGTPADNIQPRVVMIVEGVAGTSAALRSEFNIQTTVSQRLLDI
jgi:prepilin-type N-terminal cleavage/methylation domain-containing protein